MIYKTLEHVLTLQLGPFTSGNTTGAPIPRDVVTVAYTKLLKEIVSRLSSKTDTDALFDGFVPFVDATPLRGRIAWQSDLDLRRGVCDLLGDCLASRADDLLKGLDTDQMPPGAVRTLLIFPRVQVISFPEATHILLRKLSDKARLRERLQKDPNGDGYVLWALITKTFTAGGRRGKASELLVVARRYAWALGKNLSAQEWDSLHLGKLPERPKSLDDAPWRPLSKHWLPVALLSLADVAIEKGLGAKGRAQRLRGAVALGRRVHADLDLVRQEAQPAMLKSLAAHVRGLRYAAGANAPEDTQLAKLEELYLDEGISASWARLSHVAATLGDPAKDGSSWFNVGSALPAAGTISKLSDMQMVKAESLLNDNPDGALRLLKETEQRLVELGHSNQADIVDKISWLCVRLNKPADAEREAKRLMKIGEELCALGNEQARRGGKAISRATCTLAHSALLRGDRETALRLYEGREEKREASVSRWRVLRNKLGLR